MFPGSTLSDHCLRYENIPQIKLIVVLGELGGQDEYSLVWTLSALSGRPLLLTRSRRNVHQFTPPTNTLDPRLPTTCSRLLEAISSICSFCMDVPQPVKHDWSCHNNVQKYCCPPTLQVSEWSL